MEPYRQARQTTRGGWGVHAIVLDIDLGPVVQTQKLVTSVRFARMKHHSRPLTRRNWN